MQFLRIKPMDQGVIRTWKSNYRRIYQRTVLSDIETRYACRESNKNNTRGNNGLYQGYDANMSDVTKISKEARDKIESDKIARCRIKSRCLPCSRESDMEQMFGRVS